jgi:hypothetical protein
MNWEQWLAVNQFDLDMGDDNIDLMRQTYVAVLFGHVYPDLLDNAEPEDFDWCRHEIEKLIEESK